MNRAIDGAASVEERAELARALKADPLLRSEFEDHEAVDVATASLFRQLALPEDFSKRVIRRIQGVNVPADAEDDSVRLPAVRPLRARAARVVSLQRRRTRAYAIVAFVSAAAALLLALGVITGAFSANTEITTPEKTAADGRRGVPDGGDSNRTDSPTPQPLLTKRDEPPKVSGDENGDENGEEKSGAPETKETAPDTPIAPQPKPDDQIDSGPGQPVSPDKPESRPEPKPEEVVDSKPDPTREKAVPEPTQPKERDTAPATRTELGRMLVLGGRVDRIGTDGSLTRLNDGDVFYSGDRLRTKYSAVVMLQLGGADITLGKETQVQLDSQSALRLEEYEGKEKGMVAIDRSGDHSSTSFEVRCGEYSLYLMSGAAVLERKRRGMNISKAVGFATLTHETLGSILFPEDSGYSVDVEFGKAYSAPKATAVQLPSWCGKTRAQAVMQAISGTIAERKFGSNRERSWVNSNLPGKLDSLMANPTTTDAVVEFLTNAIKREQLDGSTLIKMTGEVEIAFADVTELAPTVITRHAARAAAAAENFDQWRDYFYRLMRPPVPVPDCPNDNKLKRVDDQPPRKAKQPDSSKEDPAKQPEVPTKE